MSLWGVWGVGWGVRAQGSQPAGLPESEEQITFELVCGHIMVLGHLSIQGKPQPEVEVSVVNRIVNLGTEASPRSEVKELEEGL